MSVVWGCFRINVFGWFNEEHGEHIHEYHVPRTTRIMWGVHVSGLPEESTRGICDEIRHLGQFLIIQSLPLFARNGFWPTFSSRILAKIPMIYMATLLRVPPQSRESGADV